MRVIIVGAGRYGSYMTEKMRQEDHDITVVEPDEKRLQLIAETFDVLTIRGDGATAEVLLKAGIKEADMIIAVTDSDQTNICACLFAKYYGVQLKVARVSNDVERCFPNTSEEYFEKLGIDFIVNPEKACAIEFYNMIRTSGITERIHFCKDRVSLTGIRIPKEHFLIDIPLNQIDEPMIHEMRFVAFARQSRTVIPSGEDSLQEGDEVFFMCDTQRVGDILAWLKIRPFVPERVVIVGGNHIARYLAKELEKHKMDIRLIVSDAEDAQMMSETLSKTIVFKGRPTDQELLQELNMPDVDVFAAVTHDDEDNILSCVLSKQLLVKKTYCLVGKTEYVDLVPSMMKVNNVINPKRVVINSILRFIRQGSIAQVASLREIDAEVIELIIDRDSKVLNKKISSLDFPKGAIIGAIIHNDEVTFASGDRVIAENDHLLLFYLPQATDKIKALFGKDKIH